MNDPTDFVSTLGVQGYSLNLKKGVAGHLEIEMD